jgi:hypothetical protein
MSNKLRSVVIGIVTAVWAMNFTAPIFVKDYEPSPELNVAFMAIIGVLTASYRMDKQQHEPPPKQEDTSASSPPEKEQPNA